MNKKGTVALAVVAVVLALLILVFYLVGIATRDCNKNKDCSENQYCGTDYTCHDFPNQVIVTETNFIPAAIIIGIALIIAAYIFRKEKMVQRKELV